MALSPEATNPRPIPAWRAKLASFWRWWTSELSQAMPERLAGLRGASRLPVVGLEGGDVVLIEPRAAAGPDARVALETLDPARRRTAVAALLERAGEVRARARLCLTAQESLVRRVAFPAATEENLRQVIAFEMDRLTPFRVEDVYFDHRVLSRDAAAGTLSVLLGVARREFVDARITDLRELGISVQGVTVRDDLGAGSGSLDLMPLEQRGARESSNERSLRYAMMLLVAVLLLAVLALPIWRKREAAIALLPQLNRAESDARATEAIARDLDRQVNDYNFMLARKYATQPSLAYIEDLSRLLPDNTWLQQMDLKQAGKTREVQITGETPSSSRLIELLQQSQMLQNARTSGTVTRGSQPGTERFMITAEVTPRQPPEPRGVLDGAAPTATAPATTAASPPAAPPAAPAAAPPPAAPAAPSKPPAAVVTPAKPPGAK